MPDSVSKINRYLNTFTINSMWAKKMLVETSEPFKKTYCHMAV
jgi:hypothetical protein